MFSFVCKSNSVFEAQTHPFNTSLNADITTNCKIN